MISAKSLCAISVVMIFGSASGTTVARTIGVRATAVLNCFHPEGAIFVGESGDCLDGSDEPLCEYQGTIEFRGVITKRPYHLTFELDRRMRSDGTVICKYTPTSDSAPVPPDEGCHMRSWHRCGS